MENVKKDYFMDNHFRRKLHENIVKQESCNRDSGMQRLRLGGASGIVCPVNVARFQFSAVFWNRATSHTPVVMGKCRKTQFGGMKYVEKPHFGRRNVA